MRDSKDTTAVQRDIAQGVSGQLSAVSYSLLAALLLTALAYWAPWVDHDSAALKLSGQDLGEFVKFIPEIRKGHMAFPRQLFYLPPLTCAVCLVLLAVNRQLVYPRWLRVGMLILALFLLPGLLPPAWGHPGELFTTEFRLQGVALVLGLLLIMGHGAFRQVSLRILAVTVGVLALVALLPAQWAFWAIQPHIWAAYDIHWQPQAVSGQLSVVNFQQSAIERTWGVRLGWGLWLDIAAWTVTIALAMYIATYYCRIPKHSRRRVKEIYGARK